MLALYCISICPWERLLTNVLMILSSTWSCLNVTNRNFCVDMWQWTKPGSVTSFLKTIIIWVVSSWWTSPEGDWNMKGVVFTDFLEKRKAINSDYYIALLERLKSEIVKKRPHMAKKKIGQTTHRVTSQSKQRQKCMNFTLNYCRNHLIL